MVVINSIGMAHLVQQVDQVVELDHLVSKLLVVVLGHPFKAIMVALLFLLFLLILVVAVGVQVLLVGMV